MRVAAGLSALALAAIVLLAGGAPALEAWLPPLLLCIGLVVGALGALAMGHILGEEWLTPLRPVLEATARTLAVVVLLAVPVLAAPGRVFPWAADPGLLEGPAALWFSPEVFRLRAVLAFATLSGAAWLLARPGARMRRSTLALPLVLAAGLLLVQDLVLSRDLAWFASLQGTALLVEQVAAALSGAVLVALLRGRGTMQADLRGLDRGLLTLALLTLWLWFVQFVVVWMADLPAEAAWYLRRDGAWLWLKLGVLVPALVAAVVIAIPPRAGPRRLGAVAALLLGQHAGHVWWLLRPDALAQPPLLLDLLLAPALLAAWATWWWGELLRRPDPQERAQPAASGGG